MTNTTLFNLGAPFGQWTELTRAFWDERLQDPAIAAWHRDVVGAPLPEVNDTNALDALLGVKVDAGLLARLKALRPTASSCWGGCDVRLCWTGQTIAELMPDARFFVWVEHPARLLAQWLAGAAEADPAAALAIVQSSVQGMVSLVHKHRSRCLVVHADEALSHPDDLARCVKDWLGVDPGQAALPEPVAQDPLNLLLAEQLVASCQSLLRDYERLYASCVPLVEAFEPPTRPSVSLALEAIAAHQNLLRSANSTSRQGAATGLRDDGLLQLHQVQEELEHYYLASRDKVPLDSGLLLVQLHQVQEELEHYYGAYRDLESGQNSSGPLRVASPSARIEVGTERDESPHRELSLVLQALQVDERRLDNLHLRLVEHHGRPGLVMLQPRRTPAPLAAWEPSGSEGEDSFVVFIPTDDDGKQRLQRMGASDWRIVECAVLGIEHAFKSGSASASSGRWLNVARRLSHQLAGLPIRFRFDRVDAVADKQAAGAFMVTFHKVCFGSRRMAQLQLRWRPQTAPGGPESVDLLRPPDGDVPLPANWPVDTAGAWLAAWALPLAGESQPDLSASWRTMGRTEREFLFGLLDALPAAAAAVAPRAGDATTVQGGELVAAAALPLRAACRHFHGTRLRRVVQAARGRLPA